MSLSGAEVWWSPGKQGAAKAIHFDLDEFSHVVQLILVLNPATLRPVHVRHRHKVQVAQLEDGRDYLEGDEKSWSSVCSSNQLFSRQILTLKISQVSLGVIPRSSRAF